MDGFRGWLEKAVRADDTVDWGAHTIDYPRFKKRLKFFGRRRSQIRNMIRSSSDGKISEQVLVDLLGPKTSFPAKNFGEPLDYYADAPLSHNLSDDPHSHVGRIVGPPLVVNGPSTGYVGMSDNPDTLAQSGSTEAEDNSDMSGDDQNPLKKRRTQRSIMRRLSVSERNEIIVFLEWEMDKVLMFYLSQWQNLSHHLVQQQRLQRESMRREGVDTSTCNEVPVYSGGQQELLDTDLGDEILEMIAFCVINLVTAQQILVRYDAFARAFEGTPMMNYYMKKVTKHPTSFRKILFHEELQAIVDGFVAGSEELPFVIHFKAQRTLFNEILDSLQSADALSSRDHVSYTDAFMYGARKWFLLGLFEDRLGLEPAYLTARGQSLSCEMERLAQWRKRKDDIIVSTNKPIEKKLSSVQVFNLTLNMLAAFLYCMNYYVSTKQRRKQIPPRLVPLTHRSSALSASDRRAE